MTTQEASQTVPQAGGGDPTAEELASLDLGTTVAPAVVAAPAVPSTAPQAVEAESAQLAEDPVEEGSKGGGHGIPRARLNEVNEKRREAEERLAERDRENAELRAQLAALQPTAPSASTAPAPAAPSQAQTGFDVEAAEEQYAQALLDGDTKAAVAIRRQINQQIEEAALVRVREEQAAAQSRDDANKTVAQLLGEFPWLEAPEGAEVLDLIEASFVQKVQRGMSQAAAMAEAVRTIAPKFAPPQLGSPAAVDTRDSRSTRANERGAAHSMLQPPLPQAGMGNRATPISVDTTQLSDEEFMALPKAELEKALGY